MCKPKRLRFSYNSLQPVTTTYAPAPWRAALKWLAVGEAMREAHAALRGAAASFRPARLQDWPVSDCKVPAGSAVYVYKAGGERVRIGTTV